MSGKPLDLSQWPENPTITEQRKRGGGRVRPHQEAAFQAENRVSLDVSYIFDAPNDPKPIRRADLEAIIPDVLRVHGDLKAGRGPVKDGEVVMLGWQDLPERLRPEQLDRRLCLHRNRRLLPWHRGDPRRARPHALEPSQPRGARRRARDLLFGPEHGSGFLPGHA